MHMLTTRRRLRTSSLLLPLALWVVAACDSGSDLAAPTEPLPLVLEFVGTDTITAAVGTELSDPLAVIVRHAEDGHGVKGVRLSFTPSAGTVVSSKSVTDRNGVAKVRWLLPTTGQEATLAVNFADSGAVITMPPDLVFRVTLIPDAPAVLEKVLGDGQFGPPGAALAPLEVLVRDRHGNPVPNVDVEWNNAENAIIVVPKSRTDAEGKARTEVILGERLGQATVRARVSSVASAMVAFSFEVVPASSLTPSKIEAFAGAGQNAVVNTTVEPIGVRVLDDNNHPVPGVRVEWSVVEGDGALFVPWNYTDRDGVATNIWRYGRTSGPQRVRAKIANHTASVEVAGLARPDVPATFAMVSGSQQQDTVMRELPNPYVVRVADRYGNPVPGVEVRWSVLLGEGNLSASVTLTGDDGTASVIHRLGRIAGTQAVRATIDGLPDAILFVSSALPGPASKAILHDGNDQVGAPGTLLVTPLAVKVLDEWDNPIQNVQVQWEVMSGGGVLSASASSTDASGIASVSYQLGTTAGQQKVRARVGGLAEAVFTLTAATLTLDIVSGNNQSGPVGTALAEPLRVRVRDAVTNATVPNATVEWLVVSGDGSLSATSARSDASGIAEAIWTLGPKSGQHEVDAKAGVNTARFVAFAVGPRGEARIELVSGNNQVGQAGNTLQPFVVRVTSLTGAPVEGVTIDWFVRSAGGLVHPASSSTDTLGLAMTVATLPSFAPTTMTVVARAATLSDSVVFTAHVEPNPAAIVLDIVSGNNQVGDADQIFPQPLVVVVRDLDGNPVPDVTVTFVVSKGKAFLGTTDEVTSGSGGKMAVNVMTNSSGFGLVWARAGDQSGEVNVSASLPDYPTVPNVIFRLWY